ncbi:hypothetical protein [Paenibacillus sp. FSL H8-0034]|uniref:hypothetical protein n=1 Tax=Paenibacillus sp. FSL H8-0034 TaxID=2954671 RepID=UPI0030F72C63
MLQDMLGWVRNQPIPSTFTNTGLSKSIYLDIMEQTLNAYSKEELERRLPSSADERIDDLQAYARITSIMGILIAQGRLADYAPLWDRMMEACCVDLHQSEGNQMADFSVKEIMLAFLAIEEQLDVNVRERLLALLSLIEPERNYVHRLGEDGHDQLHNINIYNMVGEYLREIVGLTDTETYFDVHWPKQLELFDSNGMYMDPNCPILYDLTTRCQIQLLLGYGYKGAFSGRLDDMLKKAGLSTLFMQSASGEFPYGGRSNQFLFNEALIAANAEYEACRYKELGDLKTAGAFKRSARLAVQSIMRWLEQDPPRHLKNLYPIDSKIGTEFYGYYDKYMATLGSFIYIAFLFADDEIDELPCPAETGGFIWETSPAFHKVFANVAGYSLQIDTKADHHYDSTGLGRIHRAGVPSELGLSTPCTATPSYQLPNGVQAMNLAIGPGWKDENGQLVFLSDLSVGLEHRLHVQEISPTRLVFELEYFGAALTGCRSVTECYTISESAVSISAEIDSLESAEMVYRIPLLQTTGGDHTQVVENSDLIEVRLGSYAFTIQSAASMKQLGETTANRNGQYGILQIEGRQQVSVHMRLKSES